MKILVYSGPGVAQESLKQTIATFTNLFQTHSIETICPKQILEENWEESATWFVLPGGADIPYTKSLNGKGNVKIKRFVENGGSFFGICAGSYYAGCYVDFAKGTDIEVTGTRELAFFPGIVRGPILADYCYDSFEGVRAAKIHRLDNGDEINIYYNGGGYFFEAHKDKDISVIANYHLGADYPAIIKCKYGKGIAILSAVHIEYCPTLLDSKINHLGEILPLLEESNEKRLQFLNSFVNV